MLNRAATRPLLRTLSQLRKAKNVLRLALLVAAFIVGLSFSTKADGISNCIGCVQGISPGGIGGGGGISFKGGGGGGFTPSCLQSGTYFAALDGTVTTAFKQAWDPAICGTVSQGYFSSVYFWHILSNTSAANAAVNVINPGTYNVTFHGSCTQQPSNGGVTGDGSSCYGDTGFNTSTSAMLRQTHKTARVLRHSWRAEPTGHRHRKAERPPLASPVSGPLPWAPKRRRS
jgi:hypothetical protein